MSALTPSRRRRWALRWSIGLGLLALALRLVYFQVVVGGSSPLQGDEGAYHGIAVSYLSGQGWRDPASGHQSERSPLVSVALVVVYGLLGIDLTAARYAMIVASALTVTALFMVVYDVTGQRMAAILAGLLLALYPPAWHWSWQLMTETPSALLVLLGLAAFYRAARRGTWLWAVVAGLIWGALALCRANFLPLLPGLWVGQLVLARLTRLEMRWTGRQWAWGALAWLITLTPWLAHNYAAQGQFVLGTTQLGQMMMICNGTLDHPYVQDGLYYKNPLLAARMAEAQTEIEWNALGVALGSAEIRAHWQLLPRAILMRALNFWVQRPHAMEPVWSLADRVMLIIWLPLLALALYSYRLWDWRQDWPAGLIILCAFLVILPFWGGPRFRFPVDALIIGRGALSLTALATWLRARLRRAASPMAA